MTDFFNYFRSGEPLPLSKTILNSALGTGETSGQYTDNGCLLRYAFSKHFARANKSANRPENDLPYLASRSYLLSQLNNQHGWIGNLAHRFMEQSLLAKADIEKGRDSIPSSLELIRIFEQEFNATYKESLQLTAPTYLEKRRELRDAIKRGDASVAREVVWLLEHARSQLSEPQTALMTGSEAVKLKDNCWQQFSRSAEFITTHISDLVQNNHYSSWKILEGRELSDGDVKSLDGESQDFARAKSVRPYFDLNVDGVLVRMFCSIDLAFWHGERFVISDLKTGKDKEAHWDESALYAWFVLEGTDLVKDPELIDLQMIYPLKDEDNFPIKSFSESYLDRIKQDTKEKIRKILSCFVPLSEPALYQESLTAENNLLSQLYKIYSKEHAKNIYTLGYYAVHKRWPEQLPQVQEDSISIKPEQVPSQKNVYRFLVENLSPTEFANCIYESPAEAEEIALRFFVEVGHLGYEYTNTVIANKRLENSSSSEQQLKDFFDIIKVNHIRLALFDKFQPSGSIYTPTWCRNCSFYSICLPGQEANMRKN